MAKTVCEPHEMICPQAEKRIENMAKTACEPHEMIRPQAEKRIEKI